jgi:hypothetical protein
MLVRAGARRRLFTDTTQSEVRAIAFSIQARHAVLPIRLPARVAQVAHVHYGTRTRTPAQWQQAQRTAWKTLHDWGDAQLARIETGMGKLEEVFFPDIVTKHGATLFAVREPQACLLPGSGPNHP